MSIGPPEYKDADVCPGYDLVCIKLGGGLITDKTVVNSLHSEVLNGIAAALASYHTSRPNVRLLLGHGNGAFGHPVAARHKDRLNGSAWDLQAANDVRDASQRLNKIVIEAFANFGLNVVSFHPDEFLYEQSGKVKGLMPMVNSVLNEGGVPLVHGAMIDLRDKTDNVVGHRVLSTEGVLTHLVREQIGRHVKLTLFLSSVPGILNKEDGSLIREVPLGKLGEILLKHDLGSIKGKFDVSGEMRAKALHANFIAEISHSPVAIIDGKDPSLLLRALNGDRVLGTWFN